MDIWQKRENAFFMTNADIFLVYPFNRAIYYWESGPWECMSLSQFPWTGTESLQRCIPCLLHSQGSACTAVPSGSQNCKITLQLYRSEERRLLVLQLVCLLLCMDTGVDINLVHVIPLQFFNLQFRRQFFQQLITRQVLIVPCLIWFSDERHFAECNFN